MLAGVPSSRHERLLPAMNEHIVVWLPPVTVPAVPVNTSHRRGGVEIAGSPVVTAAFGTQTIEV